MDTWESWRDVYAEKKHPSATPVATKESLLLEELTHTVLVNSAGQVRWGEVFTSNYVFTYLKKKGLVCVWIV